MPPVTLTQLVLVAAGSALGGSLRYLVGRAAAPLAPALPLGTLAVNLGGGFLMGALVVLLARDPAPEPWRLLVGVGLLGGFTTFSAFSLEVADMLGRGQPGPALGYALVSVAGSVAALAAGSALARAW